MKKQWLYGVVKELLIQGFTLLISLGMVVFIFPPEILTHNLWGSQDLGRPLTREYVIVCVMTSNMIRLAALALWLFFSKEARPKQSRLTQVFYHYH